MIAPVAPLSLFAPYASAPDAAVPREAGAAAHLGLRTWISPSGQGSLAFTEVAGYRVAAGLPRAPSNRFEKLFGEFEADSRRARRRPLYFGLPGSALEFLAVPRARWHVGDLPVFDLDRWRDESSIPASVRAQARRARRRGVAVRHLARPPEERHPLDACLHAWLRGKPLPPLGFLTTPFLFDPWPDEGVFVAETRGNGKRKVEGFLVASRALFGNALRVDAVGRDPAAPNGTAELLVAEAFRHAAARGFGQATLGLAPLAGRSGARSSGRLDALSRGARTLGSAFYSFAGLEAFKAKFEPDAWVPLFGVAPGPRFTPRDVLAVGRAFAGGSVARYAARSALWALRVRTLRA